MNHLVRFLLVGGGATALQFILMMMLVSLFDVQPVVGSVVGFTVSALVNYQLNRIYTFNSNLPHSTALPRFAIVAGVGLLINAALMFALVNMMHVFYLHAQVFVTAFVLAWNFGVNKYWTFAH